MSQSIKVGIIGDFNPNSPFHKATNESLAHAGKAVGVTVESSWLPTESLDVEGRGKTLEQFDGLWCSPGSPYKSMSGALKAITFARERGWPFVGTWGGFQHALVEYARNVMGMKDAEHEETAPGAPTLLISKLSCSLVGKIEKVRIIPGSLAHQAYGNQEVNEQFACNYGLNREHLEKLEQGDLRISGVDADGEVRIIELPGHPFFMGTLFLPQLLSRSDRPHPLIAAYVRAALSFQTAGHPHLWEFLNDSGKISAPFREQFTARSSAVLCDVSVGPHSATEIFVGINFLWLEYTIFLFNKYVIYVIYSPKCHG